MFRKHFNMVAAAAVLPFLSLMAHAEYPDKPVTLVVTYPAGGPADQIARTVAQKLTQTTKQNFIIDNRPGAGGNIGAQLVAKAPKDGYTLLLIVVQHPINMSLYKKPGYAVDKDFEPIAPIASSPMILVANPARPFKNVRELLDYAKKNPGKLSYGSAGNGSTGHLAMEMLKKQGGIQMDHIPYKGGAPALLDTMSGQIDLMFDAMVTGARAAESGKVSAFGVSGDKRSGAAPHLPTIAESGLPGFKAITWYGVAAPKGTPKDIVNKLNAEITKVTSNPEVQAQFAKTGADLMRMTPTDFGRFMEDEEKRWAKIVNATGATVD